MHIVASTKTTMKTRTKLRNNMREIDFTQTHNFFLVYYHIMNGFLKTFHKTVFFFFYGKTKKAFARVRGIIIFMRMQAKKTHF